MLESRQISASFHEFLTGVCKPLAVFLDGLLPSLTGNWWQETVLNHLSAQQRRNLERQNPNSLAALDLAALLRVLDQNWYQISQRLNPTPEARHFVKEMLTVRNRWAHAGADGFVADDIYRDLDTLQRFAVIIGADEGFLEEVRAAKKSLVSKESHSAEPIETKVDLPMPELEANATEFSPGQIVSLKSDPSIKGAIVSVQPGPQENRFGVFIDGRTQTFYASQLQADSPQDHDFRLLSSDQFHSYLTALQIRYPGLSTLYSLNAARIEFTPYQYRPVLRFIRSDRPRMLIADAVGVGKTIEAGLILRELQARRDVRSVLIICPRPLVIECKWQNEMKRFDERFTHLDGPTLRYCVNEMDLDGVWPEQHQKVIVPYSLFDEDLLHGSGPGGKGKKGLLDLDPPPRFDLVIVDEAHHIRNQDTFSHKAVRFFCDHAEAVVFLTATPIQLGSHDLFVLLNVLRPDLIIDQNSFEHMAGPNPFINQAVSRVRAQEPDWPVQALEALDQGAATPWGQSILRHAPDFIRTRSRLVEGNVTKEERVQLITDIEAMHTFAGIINRTRRRDIEDFTIRRPQTVEVPFTDSQRCLHDSILQTQAEKFGRLHDHVNVKFLMTPIRRQAASCLYGLAPFLEEILNRHIGELEWDEADNTGPVPQPDAVDALRPLIEAIVSTARTLDPHDPKLEALRNIIRSRQGRPNNKVILFSTFWHTLGYLYKHLGKDGLRVAMVRGDTPDDERRELRKRFEAPRDSEDALDILLFSEIGCEGLDYQFCDCMVNYDLPWNPMKIEQRIGRIDRKGQKSESVAIISLITPGTVDADIYNRCLLRIGIFNSSLGDNEEILGEITQELKNIGENYTLSDKERQLKLEQLADNKIRAFKEQDILEQKQMEFFGIRLPEDRIKKEIQEASSYWLSPVSMKRIVTLYLQQTCGNDQEFLLGEKPLKTLRLSQEARNSLLRDFRLLQRQNSTAYRDWETWLSGGNQHLPLTFESDCATQHPEAAYIMPLHPLVKQAAMALSPDATQRVVTRLKVQADEVPPGKYEFAIYQWRFHGIREDWVLQPIASSAAITAHLGHLLEKAVDDTTDDRVVSGPPKWDELDAQHHTLWAEARAMHRQRTQELAEYRRESLSTSQRARMALLEEQLGQTDNEKIQKMRRSQIAAAEADFARHIQELDIAMERADLIAEPVAFGSIHVC